MLEAPKLHDLPLDGPRTARATVKALPPVPMRVSPPLEVLLAAFASVLSRHARQDVVVVGVEGHPVALACEKNDAFCERVEKARAALRAASFTLEDVVEATSTILDRTYHPVYLCVRAATTTTTTPAGFSPCYRDTFERVNAAERLASQATVIRLFV